MSIALGEVELDLETNAVFGNLAKDSAQAFAAALTGLSPVAHPPAQTAHTLGDATTAKVRGAKGKAREEREARPPLRSLLWSKPWAGW